MRELRRTTMTSILELISLDAGVRDLCAQIACASEEMAGDVRLALIGRMRNLLLQRKRLAQCYDALLEDANDSRGDIQTKFIDEVRVLRDVSDSVEREVLGQVIKTNPGCLC
jgi:hypothetical protein